jgi:hypothetical protein
MQYGHPFCLAGFAGITIKYRYVLRLETGLTKGFGGEIEPGVLLLPVRSDCEWQPVCNDRLLALLPTGHAL